MAEPIGKPTSESTGKPVPAASAPRRRLLTWIGLAVLAAVALYGAYEYGRYDARHGRQAGEGGVEGELERLEKANRQLRLQLAERETERVGQGRERAEVSRALGELQAQLARQAQELAFYRGIVEQGASDAGVRVQQMRIVPGKAPGRFRIRLTLVQTVRPDTTVVGLLGLRVDGQGGGPVTAELPFSFRYFQRLEPDVRLPQGFVPERLTVELRPGRKGARPASQSWLWSVEGN